MAWQWVAHMKAISAQPRNAFAAESLHAQYSLRHYARLRAPFVPVLGVAAADHRWTGSRDDVLIVKVPSTAQPSRPMPFPRPPARGRAAATVPSLPPSRLRRHRLVTQTALTDDAQCRANTLGDSIGCSFVLPQPYATLGDSIGCSFVLP